MIRIHASFRAATALAVALSLFACSSKASPPPLPSPTGVTGSTGTGLTGRIVGVGDSLMAGEQSGGLLGATIASNPIAGSPFPLIPNTQGNGLYALIWSQANGGTDPLTLATSPLPLIAPPGIGTSGSILVPTSTGSLTPLQAPCASEDAAAFSFSTALNTRLNPAAVPLDVGVPGQTAHEALYQLQPTGPCSSTGLPATLAGLNGIINAENLSFYPILANFGQGVTQVQAAASLHPTLAFVWLGSNDLLKYAASNGALQATSANSFQSDITQIITTLQHAGAKVVIANLVDVMGTAYFTPVSALPALVTAAGIPSTVNAPIVAAVGTFLAGFSVRMNGYLTLTGLSKVVGVVKSALPAIGGGASPAAAVTGAFAGLQASSNAFTAGDYVSDSVATSAKALNVSYNDAIATAATHTGAALADVNTTFFQAENAPGEFLPVTGKCCSLLYQGGFFSLDGLHPSSTAYAVIADIFIAAADQAYGATIPALSSAQITAINAADLYSPH
jgi:lysophospholipase L1-like esterase